MLSTIQECSYPQQKNSIHGEFEFLVCCYLWFLLAVCICWQDLGPHGLSLRFIFFLNVFYLSNKVGDLLICGRTVGVHQRSLLPIMRFY